MVFHITTYIIPLVVYHGLVPFVAYHQKCVDPWLLKNKRTCPVCKRKVIPRPPGAVDTDSSDESDGGANETAPLLPPVRRAAGAAGVAGNTLYGSGE